MKYVIRNGASFSNPIKDVISASEMEVNLKNIAPGRAKTVSWPNKEFSICQRAAKQIARISTVDMHILPDPELDTDRVKKSECLIVIGEYNTPSSIFKMILQSEMYHASLSWHVWRIEGVLVVIQYIDFSVYYRYIKKNNEILSISSSMKLNAALKKRLDSKQYKEALDVFDQKFEICTDFTIDMAMAIKACTMSKDYKRGFNIQKRLSSNSLNNPFIQA
ncbi:unnamed protein product, partial [Rotaria magnacalcarata]